MQARKQLNDIFKVLKEKKKTCQPRLLYSGKVSFKNKGKIKTFLDREKLKESVTSRPVLQDILKKVLQVKGNDTRWKLGSQRNEEHQECKYVQKYKHFYLLSFLNL